MQRFKLTKKVRKALEALAEKLPKHQYWAYEYKTVSGAEVLKENPTAKLEDGTSVKRGMNYTMKSPIKRERNHMRRLVNAFKKEGPKGIENYIQPYIKKESPTEATEGDH